MTMLVTAAICTWNRCNLLRQALEQMTKVRIPVGVEWEVLVVNNNCTDGTDAVIDSFSHRLPLRRLSEPKPGLSHARNLAVQEARGEYILWTDNDVLVDDDWLVAYVKAFRDWPDAAFFGGPVRPHFAVTPPKWLERVWNTVGDHYGARDLGEESFCFDSIQRLPYGANFVVRAKEQQRHLYDPRLGHCQQSLVGCEETALAWGLILEGCEGWWVPTATVRHFITPERLTTRYIRKQYFGAGQLRVIVQNETLGNSPRLDKPDWPLKYIAEWGKKALRQEIRYRWRRLFAPPEIWIHNLIAASLAWGSLLNRFWWKRPPGDIKKGDVSNLSTLFCQKKP